MSTGNVTTITATTSATPSKLTTILAIIQAALAGLNLVPAAGVPAGLATVFINILQNALAAYQAEAGQPLDITKIPLEQPLP